MLLAALIWVAWTGYDLRTKLLDATTDALGIEALFGALRFLGGHASTLGDPCFGLIELTLAMLVLYWAPRPLGCWRWALIVAWAVLSPVLDLAMPQSWRANPSWYPMPAALPWWHVVRVPIDLTTGPVFAIATRSWRVGWAISTAWMVTYLAGVRLGLTPSFGEPNVHDLPPKCINAACIVAALWLWVRSERRRLRPEWECPSCGYDRRGLRPADPCPECGCASPSRGPAGGSADGTRSDRRR